MAKDWGRICAGTRLEKQVDSAFVEMWSLFISKGLRKGDGYLIARDQPAQISANKLVRNFLKTNADTLFMLDSDADIGPNFLNEFRDYEPGWNYDVLQAWYPRRGWPPEAIWFRKSLLGDTYQVATYDPDVIADVAIVGTHALLIRREVFIKQLGDNDADTFDWFFYPRHEKSSEDAAWAREVAALGFRLGATTHVKAAHIGRMITDWDTYLEYLELSGSNKFIERYNKAVEEVAAFTDENFEMVQAKVLQASKNVRSSWEGKPPKGADQVRAFYGAEDNGYLYDLLAWNFSPYYNQITSPLKEIKGQRVLIVGGGIGGEVERLKDNNNLDVFELPGILKRFLKSRFNGDAHLLEGNSIPEALGILPGNYYDVIVMIDVVEHIHPDEFGATMDALAGACVRGGMFYIHTDFGQQDAYPMHYDHRTAFDLWAQRSGLTKESELIWRKV
jgi:hypothetical protein